MLHTRLVCVCERETIPVITHNHLSAILRGVWYGVCVSACLCWVVGCVCLCLCVCGSCVWMMIHSLEYDKRFSNFEMKKFQKFSTQVRN